MANEITKIFLYLLHMKVEYVQRQISTMAGVGTVGTYTIDNAKRRWLHSPSMNKEQQKISSWLSYFFRWF